MLKKLVLLIIGGVVAAAGFLYVTQLPKEDTSAIVEKLTEQKMNLENVAQDIAKSDLVQKAITKGKEHLMESPQAQEWLAKMVKEYAQQAQGADLTDEQSQELVEVLMDVREFSEQAAKEQQAGADAFSPENQERFEAIRENGDQVFQQYLGISLTEFLVRINKSSQEAVNP